MLPNKLGSWYWVECSFDLQFLGIIKIHGLVSITAESLEPDVKILSLAILSPDRSDLVLSIPEVGNPKGLWFTLKEGSRYSLKFSFTVNSNIVSGLKYTNTVWKTGMKGKNPFLVAFVSIALKKTTLFY